MVALGTIAGSIMVSRCGWPRTLAAIGVTVIGFVISHPLGAAIGSYVGLFLVSFLVAGIVWILSGKSWHAVREESQK